MFGRPRADDYRERHDDDKKEAADGHYQSRVIFVGLFFGLFEHEFSGCRYALMVILPMRTVGAVMLPLNSISFPTISMALSISLRFPAIVTPCTGNVSSPFSIHVPEALLE